MAAVIVTFVQERFVLATFVHITNVSAATDQILTKLGSLNFLDHKYFTNFLLYRNLFCPNNFITKKQGLRRTPKLQQCTNRKVHLICKLANASKIKNLSV